MTNRAFFSHTIFFWRREVHRRHLSCSVTILRLRLLIATTMSAAASGAAAAAAAASSSPTTKYYRADGVRITHDPYAPGMAAKYGAPGQTDGEGFDPYRDSVGAGIYGGVVKRDSFGAVVIGAQYQNHNPTPGPVYANGGYTPMANALGNDTEVSRLLDKWPDLVNDVATGGAQPLHMCGMSASNQRSTALLIAYGGDIEALDTYVMNAPQNQQFNLFFRGTHD